MAKTKGGNNVKKIKGWLKNFNWLVKLKRKIWAFFDGSTGLTQINVVSTFPLYLPYSAGDYEDRSRLTLGAINQSFPFLSSLAKSTSNKAIMVENIEEPSKDNKSAASAEALKIIFDKYGSDKARPHNYHYLYGAILQNPQEVKRIFEIGLGTNNTDIVSNMGAKGKPGASLRAFRDYCPNALIYGADVDKRILFEEDRIKTFFVDQTKPSTLSSLLNGLPNDFDLVIDDGLHSPDANIASLEFGLKIVKIGGWVVIEDIAGDALSVWEVISALLPNKYETHIFSDDGVIVFAVKRLM